MSDNSVDPLRLLIADDHALIRAGTRGLLLDATDIEIVGEAADGRQAADKARELGPDVVLMDLVMPVLGGVDAIREILTEQPEIRILVLTGSNVDGGILDAIQAGALGYVDKTAPAAELVEAIRRVARGEPSIPLELTRKLVGRMQAPAKPPVDALTERESEIAALVARGLTNQQIADRVFISEGTVRTHMSRILSKLQLSNRVEVALHALREGLAPLDP